MLKKHSLFYTPPLSELLSLFLQLCRTSGSESIVMSPSHKIKGWTNDEAAVVFCGQEQLLFGTDFDFFDMIFKILHIHKKH